jgi:hypothetical protein
MKNEKIRKIDEHMNTLVPLVFLMCLWLVSCESVEIKNIESACNKGLGSCKYVM